MNWADQNWKELLGSHCVGVCSSCRTLSPKRNQLISFSTVIGINRDCPSLWTWENPVITLHSDSRVAFQQSTNTNHKVLSSFHFKPIRHIRAPPPLPFSLLTNRCTSQTESDRKSWISQGSRVITLGQDGAQQLVYAHPSQPKTLNLFLVFCIILNLRDGDHGVCGGYISPICFT